MGENLKLLNPLRYPGSKASFTQTVATFVSACKLNGFEVVEPFAGSAAVSLELVSKGLCSSAILVEHDPLVYAFWSSVFERTDELCKSIDQLNADLDTWQKMRPLLDVNEAIEANVVELGAACLFFNRTNFSGVLHAGPIGGYQQKSIYKIDCRFNKPELVRRIKEISKYKSKFKVIFGDALEYLASQPECKNRFYYLDPPYFVQGGRLYRKSFEVAEHRKLAEVLRRTSCPWLLSYDRHPFIDILYEDYSSTDVVLKYSSKVRKTEREFLATNVSIRSVDGKHEQPVGSVAHHLVAQHELPNSEERQAFDLGCAIRGGQGLLLAPTSAE